MKRRSGEGVKRKRGQKKRGGKGFHRLPAHS